MAGPRIKYPKRFMADSEFLPLIMVNPKHGATRYVHPATGRSVVVDDETMEVIHVGGEGFIY